MPDKNKTSRPVSRRSIVLAIILGVVVIGSIIAMSLMSASPSPQQEDREFGKGYKNNDGSYILSVLDGEASAIAKVRLAIAKSALDGTGVINEVTCNTLGSIAKQFDSSAQWFSSCSYSLVGSSPDTSETNVVKLSDGDYCATFTLNSISDTLTNYDFSEGKCGSYRFSIE